MKNVKVIAIPNTKSFIINYGSDDDLLYSKNFAQKGQLVKVLVPSFELIDPETNESLGFYNTSIDGFQITEVHPKYSIVQNVETVGGNFSQTITTVAKTTDALSSIYFGRKVFKDIPVNDEDISNFEEALQPVVSVGSKVEFY
ncbi:hypothetical protein U1329_02015 [Enterococcus cecorum]|uniref:hypothetical protein n=1 Tax=Enterococcus cecorum TaxID=44008 RepID=UPI002ACA1B19|nr:hypothetical protein [Enterococcus cecorum]MDZ5439284.1 hypothetical protein [Enterococcus cecorum]MDZ5497427.1 hypothetical protein [Enterococcus cecorum]